MRKAPLFLLCCVISSAGLAETKVPITLRGIIPGQPGQLPQLKKICTVPERYSRHGQKIWCNFTFHRVSSPEFEYGTFTGSATFDISENGALDSFQVEGKSSDTARLIEQLEDKYGPGAKRKRPNQVDGKPPGTVEIVQWKDARGTRLTVTASGSVRMESAALASLSERLENINQKGWDKNDRRL